MSSLDLGRGYDDVVGLNARNQHIRRNNPMDAIRLVTDKLATKEVLLAAGVPVTPTMGVVRTRRWARRLTVEDLPSEWVMKPNQGRGGQGIMIAHGRDARGWRRTSGRPLPVQEVQDHVRLMLDGEFSARSRDTALLEPVVRPHPLLARLSCQGLPDIRVICADDEPRLAMLRLPTGRSGGRANLHQGAIGAAVDIDSGRVVAARMGSKDLQEHPDTGERLLGAHIPFWDDVLCAAARCGPATGLRYVGADVVIEAQGPLILEVNARPGLQIQNVTASGMRALLEAGV